ncbi:MAG: hypothetical protein LIP23_00100 [Planctomycetes bacterium]|nr:hypothetical protein [Planctomycetota bacterium]
MKKWIYGMAALVAAGCVGLAGCQNPAVGQVYTAGSQVGDVSMYRDIQFDDIPGPQEYSLILDESHSFQGSMFRSAYLVYAGPLEWRYALDFYRSQLPLFGWTAEGVETGFDFRVLTFRKDGERLFVTVRQLRNGSRTEIQLDNVDKNDLLLKGRLGAE